MKTKRWLPLILAAVLTLSLAPTAAAAETVSTASVSIGGSHGAAVASDGTVYAWGSSDYGQVGDGTTMTRITPVAVLTNAVMVSVGDTRQLISAYSSDKLGGHTLALLADGTLYAWGENTQGQLGDGTRIKRNAPVEIMEDVIYCAAGNGFSYAINSKNELWAWGANDSAQLGDGTRIDKLSPVKIADDIKQVAAGALHSLAVGLDGKVYAWGFNDDGQLGTGTRATALKPTEIIDGGVASVAAGGALSVAVKENGELWAWGANTYGQVGNGTRNAQLIPVKVLSDVAMAAVGGKQMVYAVAGSLPIAPQVGHVLALKTDGTVWSWGFNTYGQLGDGTRLDHNKPAQILEGIVEVAASGNMSAAVNDKGELYVWGENTYGQLGDGTRKDRLSPTKTLTDIGGVSVDEIKPQAVPTKQKVFVNGVQVSFEAYNIDGANYFKLRDLAMALRETNKKFNITVEESIKTIGIGMGGTYTPVGGELTAGSGEAQFTQPSNYKVVIDGTSVAPNGYNIGGANYYKLRDFMKLIDVFVDYDAASNSVIIDTGRGYTD